MSLGLHTYPSYPESWEKLTLVSSDSRPQESQAQRGGSWSSEVSAKSYGSSYIVALTHGPWLVYET